MGASASEKRHNKRFVWFIPAAFSFVVAVATIAVVVAGAAYVSKVLDEVESLNKRQEVLQTVVATMKHASDEYDGAQYASAAAPQSLAEKLETDRRKIDELAVLLLEMVAWET